MTSINLIAKHLNRNNLKLPIEQVDTVCAFTGQKISEGVSNKKLIKKTFTDQAYLKFKSDYSSVDAALCIESVIGGGKRLNSLRNYSYFANDKELKLLKRDSVLELINDLKNEPFVLAVTYSNKKHTAYKTILNTSKDDFIITTDLGNIRIIRSEIEPILDVIKQMYKVIPEKKETSAKPTFFTKNEILTGEYAANRIQNFGLNEFAKFDAILKPYYNSLLLKFLVFILNKSL